MNRHQGEVALLFANAILVSQLQPFLDFLYDLLAQ